jgi:hypothetical protein
MSESQQTQGPEIALAGMIETLRRELESAPKFNADLSRSVRERWIAAWLYLRNRYPESDLRSDALLCRELKQLGETLLQEVRDDPGEPFISKLRSEVLDLIESLDEQDSSWKELKHVGSDSADRGA